MHHFNLKSLVFYGTAISSVVLLFKVVTAYGESNLKAPPTLNSRYRLVLNDNLQVCKQSEPIVLNIQQSGIYLNGSMESANFNTKMSAANKITSSLTGKLDRQQLSLSGKVPRAILCHTASAVTAQSPSVSLVKIQAQLTPKQDLAGTLNIDGTSEGINLTAVPEKISEKSDHLNTH
ncbi:MULTISPECIES: hypothetical protein [Nostocales]|uniref:Uncharacterized protein n=3 Tax=Nostocales TaxID=1161 RepID=A0A0C1R8U4_9CYAN|nr:hypothetical protein [Tolypothrix bouteillei]KAF3885597.1 hypothetical protein DA73_0400009080 [Tolypothrix bouteillei VB521301]